MTTQAKPTIGLLDMIQTAADDVLGTTRFYRDVLGATITSEHEQWSQVRLGGVDIGIHEKPVSPESWIPSFRVPDIAAVKAAIEAAGRPILRDYHDIPGGVVLRFDDPAGNVVQVVQLGVTEAELKA